MIYFNNIFKIPGPKDLGMSDSNGSMPCAMFRNYPGEVTWEDYYARVQKEYPVRYFFSATVPHFFRHNWRKVTQPIIDAKYWLFCHLLPSHRFHLVDIRQPFDHNYNKHPYRYGWLDTDERMMYAMFNLLVEFVEKEEPYVLIPTAKDLVDADSDSQEDQDRNFFLSRQIDQHKEYMTIYNYWKFERPNLEKEYGKLLTAWLDSRELTEDRNHPDTKRLHQEMETFGELKNQKLEDMMHRLVDVRATLWT